MKRGTTKPPNAASATAGLVWRRFVVVVILSGVAGLAWLVFSLTGAKEQDYLDVINDQEAARKEIAEILKTIKDGPTMAEAKKALSEKTDKYAEIARRANALPKPPPARVEEQMRNNLYVMRWTIDNLKQEAKRVGELPGGAEFLKQFESTKGLLTAVQP